MRRICVPLSFVALCATTLTVAPAGPASAADRTHAFRPAFSPHTGQDRTGCVVLLDGSDRWRSLLLGAPPLFA